MMDKQFKQRGFNNGRILREQTEEEKKVPTMKQWIQNRAAKQVADFIYSELEKDKWNLLFVYTCNAYI